MPSQTRSALTVRTTNKLRSSYRRCRARGETVRKLVDCLIAAVAIRNGLPLLHRDADFDALSRHTNLKTVSPV